jgi:hypothetical protein
MRSKSFREIFQIIRNLHAATGNLIYPVIMLTNTSNKVMNAKKINCI